MLFKLSHIMYYFLRNNLQYIDKAVYMVLNKLTE